MREKSKIIVHGRVHIETKLLFRAEVSMKGSLFAIKEFDEQLERLIRTIGKGL